MNDATPSSSAGWMYCLDCFYDLRGLETARCPECGRPFDPARSATFSRLPHATPVRDLLERVAKTLERSLDQASSPNYDPSETLRRLRTQSSAFSDRVAWLQQTIESLRMHLDWAVSVLERNALITDEQLAGIRAVIERAVAEPLEVVDDAVPLEYEPLSPELLELQRVAEAAEQAKHSHGS